MGFSLDEIKKIMDGGMTKEQLIMALRKKQQAWQEAMESAKYKMDCLDNIVSQVQNSRTAEKFADLTENERAWLLVKMVCVEDISVRNDLSEALWV